MLAKNRTFVFWLAASLFALAAIGSVSWYLGLFKRTTGNAIKDDPKKKNQPVKQAVAAIATSNASNKDEDSEDDEEEEAVAPKPTVVTVEDESESDDDDNEEEDDEEEDDEIKKATDQKEEAFQQLKAKYEEASRIAPKLIAGQAFQRAAEKLTECIELATQINVSNRDVMTLYNNRSAMYEKLGEFEKGLRDILTVLAMEPQHIKARTRRARIYEAQGEHVLALRDYTYVLTLERLKNEAPSNEKKVDDLSKLLAAKHSVEVLRTIRNNKDRPLPSKNHNFMFGRNFMETFPSTHIWKETVAKLSRDDLRAAVSSAEDAAGRVHATLKLVCHDLANENFTVAFKTLATIDADYSNCTKDDHTTTGTAGIPAEQLSLCWELKGTELHLRCYLAGALNAYVQAVRWNDRNIDAKLKLAGVYMELGEQDKAAAIYDHLLLSVLSLPSLFSRNGPVVIPTSSHSRSNSETERGDGTPQRQASPPPIPEADDDANENDEEVDDVEFQDAKSHAPTPMKATAAATEAEEKHTTVTMDQSGFLNESALLPTVAPIEPEPPVVVTPVIAPVKAVWLTTSEIICFRAWTLIHRANVWVARDDNLQFIPNAINKAIADIDEAIKLTESVMDMPVGKAARFTALVKSVHILSQTKQMVGEFATPEDSVRNRKSVAEAGKLFPLNETRLLMEADLLSAEGEGDKALERIEQASKGSLKDDVTPLVMKASCMCTKVLMDIQAGPQPTNQHEADLMRYKTMEEFAKVEVYYKEAMEKEPDSVEVLAQYAQYKTMVTGDFEAAVDMLRRAVPLSRSRDEAIELCQLLAANEAQWEASKELQSYMMG